MASFSDFLSGGIQSDLSPVASPSPMPPPASDPFSRFDPYFAEASKETGIPVAILKAQAQQESSFDPNVVSKTGGIGLMQIQPSTAQQPGYGVEPLDPARLTDPGENIRFGARYLAGRAKQAGVQNWNDPQQVATALTAYNGGGDPNYAQNVFRYLKPPGTGEAPAAGPVDMYGNPLAQRASANASPQSSPQPQPPAPSDSFLSYANQSATRNKPLQPELVSAMSFLPQLGVTMRVNSGGQDGIGEGSRRTGSTRHDHGGAGDVQFMLNGKALSWESPEDVPVLQQIVRQARQNGVTGIGAGPGYMNPTTTHIGFGKAAIWGAQGGSPYPALAEAVSGIPIGNQVASRAPSQGQPINPNITAAAERGRGPAADRIGRGMANAEGPAGERTAMPQMLDTTTPDNAGVIEFLRQQQGQGGLGGLGGMRSASIPPGMVIPGGGSQAPATAAQQAAPQSAASVESLIPFNKPNPFAFFGRPAQENQQAELQHKGLVYAAQQLVAQGMSPQQAVAVVYSTPLGQQLGLGAIKQQKEATVNADVAGRLGVGGDAPQQPGVAAAQAGVAQQAQAPIARPAEPPQAQPQPYSPPYSTPGQPVAQQSPTKLNTGNDTVDGLFAKRESLLKESRQVSDLMIRATTDTAKAAVQARLKDIEGRIGNVDKSLDQYATGDLKQYAFAMKQRQENGVALTPFEKWNPEQDKKDALTARGAQPEEVTGLRKEIQGLPSYKNISQAAPIYKSMMDAVTRDDRASDVNMIYGLAKIMDPTSVVRESEMTVAQAIATLPQQVQQNIKSQLGATGRLSKDVREGMMREAYSRMNSYNALFDQDAQQYRGIATKRKMDLADVIPSFGEFKPYEPAEAKPKAGANGATGAAPALREVPSQYVRPDGSSPPMPSAPPPPKAFTKEQWDKLAPGELYTDAKGDTRRKGGN